MDHSPRRPTFPRSASTLLVLVAVLAAGALAAGCNGSSWVAHDWAISADNRTGIALDIYLDGTYRVSVTAGTIGTIPAVVEGQHLLEAFDLDGRLRASRDFDLRSDFVWLLQ